MAIATRSQTKFPGYAAGTWAIDPVHSHLSFSVRQMMFGKLRGHFGKFQGTIRIAEDFLRSSVETSVDANSIDTKSERRDAYIRSVDYLEVQKYPTAIFRSQRIRPDNDGYEVEGDLTLHGITRPVELTLELRGFTEEPHGGTRAGFTATTEIKRRDFGVNINMPMDAFVGPKVQVNLEIEADLQS